MSNSTTSANPLQTEFEFTLPKGFVDDEGTMHKEGTMRLATAADEIQPLQDRRVQANPSYLTIVLLSRVIRELGTLPEVTPEVIERLFVADVAHLQELYERVNGWADSVDVTCPECGESLKIDTGPGENTVRTSVGPTTTGGGASTTNVIEPREVPEGNVASGSEGQWGAQTDVDVDGGSDLETSPWE